MAVQVPALLKFNYGTVSKLGLARTDLKRMAMSAEIQTNYMPRILGSMMLRPGTEFIGLTRASQYIKFLPFVRAFDATALIEFTALSVRVWVDDVLVTRVAVTSQTTNGTFAGNITSWTDASEAGASTSYVASVVDMEGVTSNTLGLFGTGASRAISRQTVTVSGGNINTEHALNINVARGPVTLKVGTSDGDDSYIAETVLAAGRHSLAFTPSGNFHIEFSNALKRRVNVTSCVVAGAGIMTLTTKLTGPLMLRCDQSADVLYVASGFHPARIERRGAHSWSYVYDQPEDGPFNVENVSAATISASAQSGEITLTASEPIFKSGHANALFRIASIGQKVSGVVAGSDQWSDPIRVTGIGSSRRVTITITGTWVGKVSLYASVGDVGDWSLATNSSGGETVQWTGNIAGDTFNDGYDNQVIFYRLGFVSGDYTSGSATALLSFPSGSNMGVVRIIQVASSVSASAYVLNDLGNTIASSSWWEGKWSDYRGWPSSVQLHDGRLWWFGADNIIGSVSDAFDAFDDQTEGDSGPIIRSIGKGPVDTINGALSLQRLLIFPQMSEKSIRSSTLDEPITPSNFNIKDCSTQGSAAVAPVGVDQDGFFVQKSGQRIFRLSFQGYYAGVDYSPTDVTSINPDMGLDGGGYIHLAVQRQPDTRIHAPMATGEVGVMIWDNAEEAQALVKIVFGDGTIGVVEDVVVLPGTIEDQTYYVISFLPDSSSTVRWLVKWAREDECIGGTLNKQADAFVEYTGSPTTTITGLTHLNGYDVVVWADGKCLEDADGNIATFVPSGGSITLPNAASNVIVGLPYTAQFKSTKLAYAAQFGTALAQRKRVFGLGLIMANTHKKGLQYGPDFNHLYDLPAITKGALVPADTIYENYDDDKMEFGGDWDTDSRVCLQSQAPRPCTLLAITMLVDTVEKT